MQKIGFIGVGVMGQHMVRNLLSKGFEVAIYSRSKEKLSDFLAETKVEWCDDAAACARGRDIVITMVGYPKDVEQVYFGEQGVLHAADPGTYLVDMTTTDPKVSVAIYAEAVKRKLHALDAPVSGGDQGAKNGTLSIMVGGEEPDFNQCLPVLEAMGKTIIYEGAPGSGQHTKMANQIAIAGALSGTCEALRYGELVGLNVQTMMASISQGAAGSWQMSNQMPKMIQHDNAPGFFLKHFIKDMDIALGQTDTTLPVLQSVRDMCAALEQQGHGDEGTQALIEYYRK